MSTKSFYSYTVLSILLLCLSSLGLQAQSSSSLKNDRINLTVGGNIPISESSGSDAVVTLNYSHFYYNGVGLKGGLKYIASVADVDNSFGVPLSVCYRTKSRQSEERLRSGLQGMEGSIYWQNNTYDSSTSRDLLATFLLNLFSDIEFSAGLTPGYIAGKSSIPGTAVWYDTVSHWKTSWTELANPFSLTADLGVSLNYRIGRFEINFSPAYHYSITRNYVIHSMSGTGSDHSLPTSRNTHTLRSFVTLSGGLSFRF